MEVKYKILVVVAAIASWLPNLKYIMYYPEAVIPQLIGSFFGAWVVISIGIKISRRIRKKKEPEEVTE